MNKWIKWPLRILLSGLALYLIFRKISWQETWHLVKSSAWLWLLPALLLYNASQWISARRLLCFYRVLDVPLSVRDNLLLYYKGMFYNLFLPGGIGGDGYKVHFIFRRFHTPVRPLLTATLMDRLVGLIVLAFLLVLLGSQGMLPPELLPFPAWWLIAGYLAAVALGSWLLRRLLPTFAPVIPETTLWSGAVQLLQLASVCCILQALHITGPLLAYLLLFLGSSVAAVIPFTIGGAGARELVFMVGAPLVGALPEQAVATSLIFFLLTVVSSLAGAFLQARSS